MRSVERDVTTDSEFAGAERSATGGASPLQAPTVAHATIGNHGCRLLFMAIDPFSPDSARLTRKRKLQQAAGSGTGQQCVGHARAITDLDARFAPA